LSKRIVRFVAVDNDASTFLLVRTRLYAHDVQTSTADRVLTVDISVVLDFGAIILAKTVVMINFENHIRQNFTHKSKF